jgi:hypothetical protein
MKYEIQDVQQDGYVELITVGVMQVELIAEAFHAVLNSEYWEKGKAFLANHEACSTAQLSSDEIREISQVVIKEALSLGASRFAVVMNSQLDFGNARMWQMYTEDHVEAEIQIFYDREKAVEWLVESLATT